MRKYIAIIIASLALFTFQLFIKLLHLPFQIAYPGILLRFLIERGYLS